MEDKGIASFWQPVTSTTELCNENCAFFIYCRIFQDHLNIPRSIFTLVGLISALRQTTQFIEAFATKASFVVIVLLLFYASAAAGNRTVRTLFQCCLCCCSFICAVWDWVQDTLYATLCSMYTSDVQYYIQGKEAAKWLAKIYVGTIFLGTICWLFNWIFCKKLLHWYINPQGHAWWHVLMRFNSYFAKAFLLSCHAQHLGWEPQVIHLFAFFFPYVKVQEPKKQE